MKDFLRRSGENLVYMYNARAAMCWNAKCILERREEPHWCAPEMFAHRGNSLIILQSLLLGSCGIGISTV